MKNRKRATVFFKRAISVMTLMMYALILFTGCATLNADQDQTAGMQDGNNAISSEKNDSTVSDNIVTPAGTLPIVTKPVTLSIFMPQDPNVQDYITNNFTIYMEKTTGVKLDFQFTPLSDVNNKVNLILASGQKLPDIFNACNFDNSMLVKYGQQGIFISLNKLIEEYGYWIKKIFEDGRYKDVKKYITAPDGNIYSLFRINEAENMNYGQALYINKKFMENLKLEFPTTTDEFYNVLKAFKKEDANKNGDSTDEIPLIGWNENVESFLMNAFTFNNAGDGLYLDNGVVKASFVQNGWKEGLKYLNRLCKEGLLDPQSFIIDYNGLRSIIQAQDYAIAGAITRTVSVASDKVRQEYVALDPLKGPGGLQITPYTPAQPQNGIFVITKDCENPEVAFRWADYCYNEIPSVWCRYGQEGVDWLVPKNGEIGLNGEPAKRIQILDWRGQQNSIWNQQIPQFLPKELNNGVQAYDPNAYSYEKVLFDTALSYKKYAPPANIGILPNSMYISDADMQKYADLKTLITQYYREMLVRFVTGDSNIDTEYDKYLEELKKMGLDEYLQMTQQAYDNMFKNN